MTRAVSSKYLDIDQKMIWELASGLEEGVDVAKRYGINEEMWEVLSKRQDIITAVAHARSELERNGTTFKNKARLMADELMSDMFQSALGGDVPVKDKAAALAVLTRVGELEPKANLPTAQGAGFSISITIPAGFTPQTDDVVEANAEEKTEETAEMSLSFNTDKRETDG